MSATCCADLVSGLALQPIERRVGEVRERNAIDRAGVDDTGNRAHGLHFRVDEGDAPVEVLVAEQRRLERQQLLAPESEVGVPQVLKASAAAGRRRSAARPRAPFRRRSASAGTSGCARPPCRVRRRAVRPAARAAIRAARARVRTSTSRRWRRPRKTPARANRA